MPPFALMLLLSGCGGGNSVTQAPEPEDPAVTDALADPIMTDPDLTSQDAAHTAITIRGPAVSALPPIDRSDGAIAAAKEAAAELAGGSIADAPDPAREDLAALRGAITAAQMAKASAVTRGDCIDQVSYTARWAAVLPAVLAVYPRGAVDEAAGTDAPGCALRAVHFRTPVSIADVAAFYNARLRGARHGGQDADRVLRGRLGGSAYVIYIRPAEDGLTQADIVVAS